jgi:hypothetical protein
MRVKADLDMTARGKVPAGDSILVAQLTGYVF